MRLSLGIQYDGSQYHGWQRQSELETVQARLETALSQVADQPVQVVCAGRTDTGVHATGQVVHCDVTVEREMNAWIFGTNRYLPRDISVQWAKPVPDEFHARFSARSRAYRYFIYNHVVKSSVFANYVSWHYAKLDETLMAKAAAHLVGEHDFSAYRSVGCQSKNPIRRIEKITVQRHGHTLVIDVVANGFLHHMVRNIVGVLFHVGMERQATDWALDILKSRDRRLGGVTAPPYGLYLYRVGYPVIFDMPVCEPPQLIL